MKEINVVAVADTSRTALRKAERLGIHHRFSDYRVLLDQVRDIEAVIIALPNYLHFPASKLALESGLNVFTEKPIANTVEECRDILRLVQKSGRKFTIGHNLRFVPAIQRMKESLEQGTLGDLQVVTIEDVINGPIEHAFTPKPIAEWWFDRSKSGGGALKDIGYHLIDLFQHFVGDCRVETCSLNHYLNLPVEDGAIVMLRSLESDIQGILNLGWYQKTVFPKYNFRLILHGTAGYLSSDELTPRNLYTHAMKEGVKNLLRRLTRKPVRALAYTYWYESYYRELQEFFECIRGDTEPFISAQDGLKTIAVIDQAYEIASQRKPHPIQVE